MKEAMTSSVFASTPVVHDFSACPLTGKYYGGSEHKLGISMGGKNYMLKFQKNSPFGLRHNHISEFLGSHIFNMLGLPAHTTLLGMYKGEQVVACEDFNTAGSVFVPFNEVGESTLEADKSIYQYSYSDIMQMLHDNSKLTEVDATICRFWDMYIVDALLGNFDRHGSNWGFFKENNAYTLAPVFDNGSCLFPMMIDEVEMQNVMHSRMEIEKRIFTFPTSQIKLNGKKSSYYEVISSLSFKECNDALIRICPRVDLTAIHRLIQSTPFISDITKQFYFCMLKERFDYILLKPFERLVSHA